MQENKVTYGLNMAIVNIGFYIAIALPIEWAIMATPSWSLISII